MIYFYFHIQFIMLSFEELLKDEANKEAIAKEQRKAKAKIERVNEPQHRFRKSINDLALLLEDKAWLELQNESLGTVIIERSKTLKQDYENGIIKFEEYESIRLDTLEKIKQHKENENMIGYINEQYAIGAHKASSDNYLEKKVRFLIPGSGSFAAMRKAYKNPKSEESMFDYL